VYNNDIENCVGGIEKMDAKHIKEIEHYID
jgi:hypothetical protein